MPINPSLARLCDHRFKPRTVMESPVHVKCAGHPPASYPTSHPLSWLCFLCIITLKIKTLPTVAQPTFTDLQSNFLSFFSCVFSLEHTSGHLSNPQIIVLSRCSGEVEGRHSRLLNAKCHWLVSQSEPLKREIKKDETKPAFLQVGFERRVWGWLGLKCRILNSSGWSK